MNAGDENYIQHFSGNTQEKGGGVDLDGKQGVKGRIELAQEKGHW